MHDFHYSARIGPNGDLHLHGVPLPSGEEVNVTVEPRHRTKGKILKTSLAGIPVEYLDPFGPATPPEDWEALNNAPA